MAVCVSFALHDPSLQAVGSTHESDLLCAGHANALLLAGDVEISGRLLVEARAHAEGVVMHGSVAAQYAQGVCLSGEPWYCMCMLRYRVQGRQVT